MRSSQPDGHKRLAVLVVAPAGDGLVGSDSARVSLADGDGGVPADGGIGLASVVSFPVFVVAPAGDGLVDTDGAGMILTDGD